MPRNLIGIRRRREGWQVHIRVHGVQHTKQFPFQTPLEVMRAWRLQQVARYGDAAAPAGETFAEDIATYLRRVSAMPSYPQRAAHLALWAQALGHTRPRRTITTEEIDVVLQGWLETLAPGTVRKRRTALQSFFAKMDGKKSPRVNPVKGTDNPKPPAVEARALDYLTIERVLDAMGRLRSTKPGAPLQPSLSPLRARVIAHTGIPPGLLQHIVPSDLVLTGTGSVRVRARQKGQGIAARTLPLTPDGLAAFRAFHAANAYGRFGSGQV